MSYVCAISGEVPSIPVISLRSKCLFEKRLLDSWVKENGTDPINNEPMTIEDILELNIPSVPKPQTPSLSSIPQLLNIMQNEWDSLMLYTHKQSLSLSKKKKELYTALYQKDGACRVIARLSNEISNLEKSAKNNTSESIERETDLENVEEEEEINEDDPNNKSMENQAIKNIQENSQELMSYRKQHSKTVPADLVSVENLKNIEITYTNSSLHSSVDGKIFCLDIKNDFLVTGGGDKQVIIFDKNTEKIVNKHKIHTKKVTSVKFHPNKDLIISGSIDKEICLWNYKNDEPASKYSVHNSSIVDIEIHPHNDYFISGETKFRWLLSDIELEKVVFDYSLPNENLGTLKCHPDGLILAAATKNTTDNKINIFDICSGENVAKLVGDNKKTISLSFSQNGYHLVSLSDNKLNLWDLRKLKIIKEIEIEKSFGAIVCNYDDSGHYISLGGKNGLHIFAGKTLGNIKDIEISKAEINAIKFCNNGNKLISVGGDKFIRYFQV